MQRTYYIRKVRVLVSRWVYGTIKNNLLECDEAMKLAIEALKRDKIVLLIKGYTIRYFAFQWLLLLRHIKDSCDTARQLKKLLVKNVFKKIIDALFSGRPLGATASTL